MRSFFGATLLGCGILIAGLSGLCTLLLLATSLAEGMNSDEMMYLPAALIFAGVPFIIGLGIALGGRHLIRSADREDAAHPAQPQIPPSPASPPGPDDERD